MASAKMSRGDKRALFKRALCSLPDFWPYPPHASLPCLLSPPFSIPSILSELEWAITSPKKGQAMQRCHEEQSARSKGARLSPLDLASAIGVRIDDVGSILKFRIGFLFWREFCWFLPVRVAPGVDTEFPYRVRIVDRGG